MWAAPYHLARFCDWIVPRLGAWNGEWFFLGAALTLMSRNAPDPAHTHRESELLRVRREGV